MSILVNKNIALIAVSAAVLAVTGCSAKGKNSQIAIAPLGMNSITDVNGGRPAYNGGPLVNNNDALRNAAGQLQSTVYFAFDSSDITSQSANVLNQHAALLGKNQGSRVLVVGHTDPRGSREYNMALGERRAMAVRQYLSSKGADVTNVEISSRGEEEPAAAGNSKAAYAKDRRAVLSY